MILVGLALLLLGGGGACATKRATLVSSNHPTTAPVQMPRAKDELTLDQIEPKPWFASTRPTTASAASTQPAPIEALVLFAEARDAMIQGQRFTAINLLEKAIKIDPDSYELR